MKTRPITILFTMALLISLLSVRPVLAGVVSSNTGEPVNTAWNTVSNWLATSFTTDGSNYQLDDLTLILNVLNPTGFQVRIFTDNSGEPGSQHGTALSGVVATGTQTFTASGINLNAGTTYWIVASGGMVSLSLTNSDTQTGWEIGNETKGSSDSGVNWDQQNAASFITQISATVPAANTAPSVTLDASELAWSEPDPETQISPFATVTDSEDNFDGGTLTVQITANPEAADRLSIMSVGMVTMAGLDVQVGGITRGTAVAASVTGGSALTVTLNSAATAAHVQDILRAIGYNNISDNPGTSVRIVTFIISDDALASDTKNRNIRVTAVNDTPTDISLDSTDVDENRRVNTVVGNLSTTDPDG